MAVRVELDLARTRQAIEMSIASLKRQRNTAKNPAFFPIIDKDIAEIGKALDTLQEVK